MLSERRPISTERPTCGNRLRSCRSPICSYAMPTRSNTTNGRRKYFETNLIHSFSLGCMLAFTFSVIRMQEENRLNESQQDGEGYLPHSGAHHPLSRHGVKTVTEEECFSVCSLRFIENP